MRLTETPNPLTEALDQLAVGQQIRAFRDVDLQLFGSAWGSGLGDAELTGQIEELRGTLHDYWDQGGTVLITGAGTSGRLGLLAAHLFGAPDHQILPLMAGGFQAFVQARERVEDQVDQAVLDIATACASLDRPPFLIGISCGLSAPYVLAQIEWMLQRDWPVAAIGFNRIESVYDIAVGTSTAGQILGAVKQRGALLQPRIGPEGLTGSTRLKGGSATLILLAWLLAKGEPDRDRAYQLVRDFYAEADGLSPVIAAMGEALLGRRPVTYWSSSEFSLTAIIDASECGPTFGAEFNDLRAFGDGGWDAVGLASLQLPECDFAAGQAFLLDFPMSLRLSVGPTSMDCDHHCELRGLAQENEPWLRVLWMKLTLNLVSTLAHVASGKVYGNRMIDLRLSNQKLWARALQIVADISGSDRQNAERCLRQVIGVNCDAPLVNCVRAAAMSRQVVPRAVLMAKRDLTLAEASALLVRHPKVVDAIGAINP